MRIGTDFAIFINALTLLLNVEVRMQMIMMYLAEFKRRWEIGGANEKKTTRG
jgi:hypothetical protein